MEVILKTLHYFSILFAGGVTVGSGVIQAAYMKAGEAPPPYIGKAFACSAISASAQSSRCGSPVSAYPSDLWRPCYQRCLSRKTAGCRHRAVHFGLCQPACVPGDQSQAPAERGPDEAPCSGWAGRSGTRHRWSGGRLFPLIRRQQSAGLMCHSDRH